MVVDGLVEDRGVGFNDLKAVFRTVVYAPKSLYLSLPFVIVYALAAVINEPRRGEISQAGV